ncbi:MAG: hypothetical protein CYPHOPRED_003956, partial [Cyphobasidiales sp. Tagirdzhanova-0007]
IALLNPNQTGRPDGVNERLTSHPRSDTIIEGHVSLTLPTAKHCKKLKVEVNLIVRKISETYETLHQTVEIITGTQILGPGEHAFAFSFVVPSDTAASEESDFIALVDVKTIATASGMGKYGGDLVAETQLYLVSNHSETGGVLPGFSLKTETDHDVLGPVGIDLYSKYLLVAGYLNLSIVIPSISQPVQIKNVRVQLVQDCALQSRSVPARKEVKSVIVPVWSSYANGHSAAVVLNPQQEFILSKQFRLPDDVKLRASTAEHSQTGIRVSHRLQILIIFMPLHKNPKRETMQFKIDADALAFALIACARLQIRGRQVLRFVRRRDGDCTANGVGARKDAVER